MMLQRIVTCLLITVLVAPLTAKPRRDAQVWRSFAEKLEAGAFVKVTLNDRTSVKGHFITIDGDTMRLKPRTRIPVPIRDFNFSDIASIDRQNQGWSPGAKVVTGVLVGIGTGLLLVVGILLSLD